VRSLLLGDLVEDRIEARRREAAAHRAVAAARVRPSPWKIELGVRLIAWGCRLWLSGHGNALPGDGTGRGGNFEDDRVGVQFARRAG
jgi:hypothetical protein